MLQHWQEFLAMQGGIFEQGRLAHFGAPQLELKSLQEFTCLTALSNTGLLCVKHSDAKTFLQGQVTCNLDEISPTKSLLGAHCNLKGRMQSLFRIFQQNDTPDNLSYLLVMPDTMLQVAQLNFNKYALFSKIKIESEDNLVGIGLYGPNATILLTSAFPEMGTLLQQPYDCLNKETKQGTYFISRLPGQSARYEIWGCLEIIQALWMHFSPDCKAILPDAWELLDIQSGIPAIYPQTIDQILPHHANLSLLNGISYTKGCYLGQEIIARMQYRGKIKKHLYRAYAQEGTPMPPPGSAIYGNNDSPSEPGIVVRATRNTAGNIELLVVLDDNFKNFENVSLYSPDGPKIQPLDLPYSN